MTGRVTAAFAALVVFAAACTQPGKVDDGRVQVASGSYRAPVVVNATDGRAFALALRTDRTPNEVWAVALDGSGACSLGAVHGTDVRYDATTTGVPTLGTTLGGPSAAASAHPIRFIVGGFTDGSGTIRFFDEHCDAVMPRLDDVRPSAAPSPQPVDPSLAGGVEPSVAGVFPVVDASGWAYALETGDGNLHLVDPWSGSDTVLAHHVTGWGVDAVAGVWAIADGVLREWQADGTELRHFGTAVTEAATYGGVIAYIDAGDVWTVDGPMPRPLAMDGNACTLRFLEDGTLSYLSPCAEGQLTIAQPTDSGSAQTLALPYGVVGSYGHHVVAAHAGFGTLFYASQAADGTHTLWAKSLNGMPFEVGPFRDVIGLLSVTLSTGRRGGPRGIVGVGGGASSAPDAATYLGVETADGTNSWGSWDGRTFTSRATHVVEAFDIPNALITMGDVRDGAGTVRVFGVLPNEIGPTPPALLTVPDVGATSVVVPTDLRTLIDLEGFDAASGTGDLVVRDASGDRVVIDRSATGYADVFQPVRGFVYTVAGGARSGMWLAVTGTD